MGKELKEIGSRMREMRELEGKSAADICRETGIDPALYAAYEAGEAEDVPVGFLFELAGILGVQLSSLLTGGEPKLHEYCLVRADQGLKVDRRKEYDYRSLASNFSHKKAEPLLVTVKPETGAAQGLGGAMHFYSHPGQEFNYLLEGRLKVVVNSHEIVLEKGDSLFFDSGFEHGMSALDGKPAKFLAIIL
jgi:transcriptional regulator with XRE-family HTH domain